MATKWTDTTEPSATALKVHNNKKPNIKIKILIKK